MTGSTAAAGLSLAGAAAVASGAAVGALLRWSAAIWLNGAWKGFPLGTLAVNAVGGFAIGIAMVIWAREPDAIGRLFFVTGVLGGLTTFSAFSAESLALLQRGDFGLAGAHTLAHVIGALVFAAAGFALARSWAAP